jgi:hypothetical protein
MIPSVKRLRNKKLKNWKNFKSKNAKEDMLKWTKTHNPSTCSKRLSKAYELCIQAYQNIHKEFPLVRFYNFHQQLRQVVVNNILYEDDYSRPDFLPDGYFLEVDERGFVDMFLIEVENKSRFTKERLDRVTTWFADIDCCQETGMVILEFNRFGNYQRTVWTSGNLGFGQIVDNPLKLLKYLTNKKGKTQ